MKAHLHSIRIAPKKANLIARLVRGMTVPAAMEALRRTHKKGARLMEDLLRSAIANASHNDKQDPQMMIVKTIVVNQADSYRRGMPKARGQTRPYRKFMSHISLHLGFPEEMPAKKGRGTRQKTPAQMGSTSQPTKNPVKKTQAGAKTKKKETTHSSHSGLRASGPRTADSSVSSDSSAS